MFNLQANFETSTEQKRAIDDISQNILAGKNHQVLLGVTGSGKTFTMANVIQKLQRPALVISHNKTLAAQLYQELKDFFPSNAVSYFVSYYDYYQPEAYIPSTDTYIEKDADINETIDKLRLAATTNLLTRNDTIVVASVSCIYNIGSPKEYGNFVFEFSEGAKISRGAIFDKLLDLQYERSDFGFKRGTFRVRGEVIDIYPAYSDEAIRIETFEDTIKKVDFINAITGESIAQSSHKEAKGFVLYPAKHFMTNPATYDRAFGDITNDLKKRVSELTGQKKQLEAYRLKQKVKWDLDMIKELGYVKGIENYSRYFDGRAPGEAPYTLLDYFNKPFGNDWLLFIDESHMTFPQIRGMYNGDLARKKTLIDYGFRLPSALDNRPLRFEEFLRRIPNFIAMSATPASWELSIAGNKKTEILVRPTGIPDPKVNVRSTKNQVQDVIAEITKVTQEKNRALVTTLTKKTAEDLATYLKEKGFRAHYLHSDVATLDRSDTLDNLRRGEYDVLIGINLLREGLDLPEVALVAILDADKEGFLRSDTTLIQTMGRAARHVKGRVILYADRITGSIERALDEVSRRRAYQIAYNKKHNIIPKSIEKPIREKIAQDEQRVDMVTHIAESLEPSVFDNNLEGLTPKEKRELIKKLTREMKIAAQNLDFEMAACIRDKIRQIA